MLQPDVELPSFVRQNKDRSTSTVKNATQRDRQLGDRQLGDRQLDRSTAKHRSGLGAEEVPAERPLVYASEPTGEHNQERGHIKEDRTNNNSQPPLNGKEILPSFSIGNRKASRVANSAANNSVNSTLETARSSSYQIERQASSRLLSAALKDPLEAQHLQSQRLRQVERKLRSSLDIATVLGSTVVETAAFLQARQVSLLSYDLTLLRWQPVAQYCENQFLSWQRPLSFHLDEFPTLIDRLQRGYSVCLDASLESNLNVDALNANALDANTLDANSNEINAVSMQLAAEARRWRSQWNGNWLLIPVKRRRTTEYALNRSLAVNHRAEAHQAHWGIMALAVSEQHNWSNAAVRQGQSIAIELEWAIAQASQHKELLQANQELQKLALSDGLTRLANRRRFDEHLSDEWQRLARDKQPLSLILCDLDHFKRYNDTFGHPAGDRCLIRVARALLNAPQRPADLVARYGGEEFAVILPNTDTHGAWRVAQKIHENIRELKIEHAADNEEKYVTVTMGVSTVLPGHKSTAQMLVQASDLALYHAKQQGRNRTYIHAHYNTIEADFERDGESLDITPSE